jgi:Ca-activated chloride channel family protein
MTLYAYTAWDSLQDSAALPPTAVLEALTDDLLQSGDLDKALHEFLCSDDISPDGTQALSDGAELLHDVAPQQQEEPPPSAADACQQPEQQVQQLEACLEQAGLVRRTADGLRLTPQGARRIGAKALRDIFHAGRRRGQGYHPATQHGRPGPLTGETKVYEFGDAFDVHLQRTLLNALLRHPRLPLHLHPQDFEVYRREPLTHSATVIMLDMSSSMELFGRQRFTAAKKVALALAQLIGTLFPRDALHIVGFGDTARQIPVHELPHVTIGHEHTNTQAGLRLARTLLRRQRTAQKHILLITDGRPTAIHLDGQFYRHTRGLHPVILEETYKEAKRCREQEITLNTFMLADEEPLVHFVKRLTAISRGRALYTTPEQLGHYIIEDYVRYR